MHAHSFPIDLNLRFSQLINDYIVEDKKLKSYYSKSPSLENFESQINQKKASFTRENRDLLTTIFKNQYSNAKASKYVLKNIDLLISENTFTITTGHQLCLMTGPLYFIYKIVSTINLCIKLKEKYPKFNFIPIYWMASEDHDFDEISSFKFQDKKFQWKEDLTGPVGKLPLEKLKFTLEDFESCLGNKNEANQIRELIKNSYQESANLSEATFKLVNQLFGNYGLLVLEPNKKNLKKLFINFFKKELTDQFSFHSTEKQINNLKENYNKAYSPQVNPRNINLFYLLPDGRYRIEKKDNKFIVKDIGKSFLEKELIDELEKYPERFSPNVILRPLYQEVLLPNLCYIGGAAEISYWLQLKTMFDKVEVPFPLLLVRNSVLLYSKKQANKLKKLEIKISDLFYSQNTLDEKKVKEASSIDLNLEHLKIALNKQFDYLRSLVSKTDKSFEGAVNAQEKKQINGINKLEKRLLKAQKKSISNQIERIQIIRNQLFPENEFQERKLNFFTIYNEIGEKFIPLLIESLDPLDTDFNFIEF